jgi:HK97 family phage major capsid protein
MRREGFLSKATGEGIFQNSNVPVVTLGSSDTTYATTDEDDLIDVINQVDESALNGAKWYTSCTVVNAPRKLEASDGHEIIQAPTAGQPATLWSFLIEFVRFLPKTSDGS